MLWEAYFSSVDKIVLTTLEVFYIVQELTLKPLLTKFKLQLKQMKFSIYVLNRVEPLAAFTATFCDCICFVFTFF